MSIIPNWLANLCQVEKHANKVVSSTRIDGIGGWPIRNGLESERQKEVGFERWGTSVCTVFEFRERVARLTGANRVTVNSQQPHNQEPNVSELSNMAARAR